MFTADPQYARNYSYCKDLNALPATEVSAWLCWFNPSVTFEDIYYLDRVSNGFVSGRDFEVFRRIFSAFLATEYEKKKAVIFVSFYKNKWELY